MPNNVISFDDIKKLKPESNNMEISFDEIKKLQSKQETKEISFDDIKALAPQTSQELPAQRGFDVKPQITTTATSNVPDGTIPARQEGIYEPVTSIGQRLKDFGEIMESSVESAGKGFTRVGLTTLPMAIGGEIQRYGETMEAKPVGSIYEEYTAGYSPQLRKNIQENKKIAEFGKKITDKTVEKFEEFFPDFKLTGEESPIEQFAYKLGGAGASMAQFLGASLLTGGSALAPGFLAGFQQGGLKYRALRDAGYSPEEASAKTGLYEFTEGGLEGLGFNFLLKKYGSSLANFAIRSGTEALQEMAQTGGEMSLDVANELREKPEFKEVVMEIGESGLIGWLIGAPTALTVTKAEREGLIPQLEEMGLDKKIAKKLAEKIIVESRKEAEQITEKEIEEQSLQQKLKDEIKSYRDKGEMPPEVLVNEFMESQMTEFPQEANKGLGEGEEVEQKTKEPSKITIDDKQRLEQVKIAKQEGFTKIQKKVFVAELLKARDEIKNEDLDFKGLNKDIPYLTINEAHILNTAGKNKRTKTANKAFFKKSQQFEKMGLIKPLVKNPKTTQDWELTETGKATSMLNGVIEGYGDENDFVYIKLPDDGSFKIPKNTLQINEVLKKLKVRPDYSKKYKAPDINTEQQSKPTTELKQYTAEQIDRALENPVGEVQKQIIENETQGESSPTPQGWVSKTNGTVTNPDNQAVPQNVVVAEQKQLYEAQESKKQFNALINDYVGKLNWNLAKVQSDYLERGKKVKKKQLDKKSYDAINLYIEYANRPELIEKYYDKLPSELQELVDKSKSLTQTEINEAQSIIKRLQELGELGQKLGILETLQEDYINHIWVNNKKGKGKKQERLKNVGYQSFGTKFKHSFGRVFQNGNLQGISLGYEPLSLNASELLRIYEERFFKVAAQKVFIENLKQMVLPDGKRAVDYVDFEKINDGEYKFFTHPAFTKYKYIGEKINPETKEVVPNIVKKPLMVHKDIYNRIDDLLAPSGLRKDGFGKALLSFGALGKSSILTFSGFHYVALGKTAAFYGVNPFIGKNGSFVKGLDLITQSDPIVKDGVEKGGLTLGAGVNVEYAKQVANQAFDYLGRIDRGFLTEGLRGIKEKFDYALWDQYYTGLKSASYRVEYLRNISRYPDLSTDEIHQITARGVNDNFGGLNWEQMGISKTQLDWMRLALLAPDWTLSNWRFFTNAVKLQDIMRWVKADRLPVYDKQTGKIKGYEKLRKWRNTTKGESRYMGKVMTTLGLLTAVANTIMWGKPISDDPRKWYMIQLPYQDQDGNYYHFDLFGHFFEPIKAISDPLRWAKGKQSVLLRMGQEQLDTKDWRGNWIGNVDDLAEGKLYRSKYKQRPEQGFMGWKSYPSRVIHAGLSLTPIPIRSAIDTVLGEKSISETVGTTLGLPIHKSYKKKKSTARRKRGKRKRR